MKTSRKEFIKRAHEEACSDWKLEIETEFPKLFPKAKHTESGWYMANCNDSTGYLCYFTNPSNSLAGEYWIAKSGSWNTGGLFTDIERPATDKEVEDALIKEAKKRGYKEGNYKCLSESGKTYDHCSNYKSENEKLFSGWSSDSRNILFKEGKWATIIEDKKETTLESLEKRIYELEKDKY